MFSVAYSARFVHSVFFGSPARDLPRKPHEPTRGMLAPSALLVLACLLVGIFPQQTIGPALHLAVSSILGADTPEFSLKVWHGFTAPLFMSVLAFVGGILMYAWLHRRKARALAAGPWRVPVDGKRVFDTVMVLMVRASARSMGLIYSRRLQMQLLLVVVVAFASALVPLLGQTVVTESPLMPMQLDAVFAALWLVGGACAVGAAAEAKYRRPCHLPDIRLVLRAGSGVDADRRRSSHDGAAAARTAMDAAPDPAQRGATQGIEGARASCPGLRDCRGRRSRDGRSGPGNHDTTSR
jgi:multicomponent K+:H+ antiporter subunit A